LLLDLLRAAAAGAGTIAVGALLQPVHPAIRLPVCVAVFAVLAAAAGLVGRADLALVRGALRRDRSTPPASNQAPPPPGGDAP
jgi:hypothetical protein